MLLYVLFSVLIINVFVLFYVLLDKCCSICSKSVARCVHVIMCLPSVLLNVLDVLCVAQ